MGDDKKPEQPPATPAPLWDRLRLSAAEPTPGTAPPQDAKQQQNKHVGQNAPPPRKRYGKAKRHIPGRTSKGHPPRGKSEVPYLFDKDKAARIIQYIKLGAAPETAAKAAGINAETLRNWLKRAADEEKAGKKTPLVEWQQQIEKAAAEVEVKALAVVDLAASETVQGPNGKLQMKVRDWQAATWLLQRIAKKWRGDKGGDTGDDGEARRPIVHIYLPDNGRGDSMVAPVALPALPPVKAPPKPKAPDVGPGPSSDGTGRSPTGR